METNFNKIRLFNESGSIVRSMGIRSDYHEQVQLPLEAPSDVFVYDKIVDLDKQAKHLAKNLFLDNDEENADLLADDKDRFAGVVGDENFGKKGILVEKDPDSHKFVHAAYFKDEGLESQATSYFDARWDKEGNLEKLTARRVLDGHVEELEIRLQKEKGLITIDERFKPYFGLDFQTRKLALE